MIAYLEKYDTTVNIPDDASQKDVQDINDNFHSYVNPQGTAQPQQSAAQSDAGQPSAISPSDSTPLAPKWQPNFYEGLIKPILAGTVPGAAISVAEDIPGAKAFAGKAIQEGTFGAINPAKFDPSFSQEYQDHPADAGAGAIAGGVGSLLETGGALRIAGLGAEAASAGKAAVEAGMAAGQRFIPRAIMTGATFGTRTFIAETVKAFEDGNVNLEQFGKDVLKDTAFGATFGVIGGLTNAVASVSSAGALGFLSSKMSGSDNKEASLNAAIWAAFETVGSAGKNADIRMEAISNLKESIGEYIGDRNPEMRGDAAHQAASAFVDHTISKAGYANAEEIAKSGPENLLEGIEKLNQTVRTAKVPTPLPAEGEPLPRLPAPVQPEAATPAQQEAPVTPKSPIEKFVDTIKGMAGIAPDAEKPVEPKPLEVKGDTYEEKIQSLKDQGQDISKMPESAFPEDMKDVYHFEQARTQGAEMEKGLGEIAERFQVLGIKPNEGAAVFEKYGLDQKGQLGQPTPFYHGSGIKGITKIDPNITSHEGLFGQGFYVTSNPDVAKGYATSRGKSTGQSTLYKTILNEGKTLDLESPLSEDFKQALFDQAGSIDQRFGYDQKDRYGNTPDSLRDILKEKIEAGKIKTNQDLFREFRDGIRDISVNEAHPTSEFVEDFQELTDKFRKKGFDALTYTGGLRQGKGKYPNHKVVVVLNPSMVSSLSELSPNKTAYHPGLINSPIEYQYKSVAKELATQRGLDPEKPNAQVIDHAEKAVDLINGYFNPQSQEVKTFAEQHQDSSDHEVAQMAHDRDLLEAASPELLKAEIEKAKQEGPIVHAMSSSGATMERTNAKAKQVEPTKSAPQVAAGLHEYKDEITNLVTPYKASPLASQIFREKLGLMARRMDMAEAALEDARKMFAKWTPEQVTEFYDKAELGQNQETPELTAIADALKKPLKDLQQEINKETGRLSKPIENYLPHAWEQGDKAIPQAIINATKRPWQGSKAFLKKRSIDTFKEGIQAGLKPTSWNPVDLVTDKLKEMSKFLAAHQTLNELKKEGLANYVKVGKDAPEGFVKINDGISDVYKSPMIAVKEAYDEKMMQDLNAVAKSLGIDLERSSHTDKGAGGFKSGDLWGLSKSDAGTPGQPGSIWTKFAGPESALAHELGHQLDHIYGLQNKFLSDPKIDEELSKLADERISEKGATDKFKKYIQEPSEKMAAMMEAYIHAPELLKEVAPTTYGKLTEFLKGNPKLSPLTDIKPSLVMGVNEGEVHAGGAVIAGHYYVQPDAARIINNYLSPGMSKSKIIRAIRTVGNTINQFQLGFSAFHMNFTSSEAIATQIGEAIDALAHGDIKEFARHAMKVPFAPITTVIRGDKILKAWRGQGQSSSDEMLANIIAISGGRAHMDQFYQTKMVEQMQNNFKAGQYIQGILRAPLAAVDAASRPIMEHLVPRMKLAIISEMLETELRNNPDMTHEQLREVGGKIVDTVDDRMGQVIYENLFWNKTLKDALMLTFRSVGWNHGLLRLVVGSGADAASIVNDVVRGRAPSGDKFNRLKYWLGSAIFIFTANALYQRLKTGKGPSELKDYVLPKNGGVDEHGNPTRAIPFQNYFKDLYHMGKHPITTVENKLQPMWAIIAEALSNKDYFGQQIIDPNDSDKGMSGLIHQIGKEAEFLGKSVLPFSVTNMNHNASQGNRSIESVLGPWIGDIPAPYDIDQTKAQSLAHEINAGKWGSSGRTEEQVQRSKLLNDITREMQNGNPAAQEHLSEAYEKGLISHQQMKTAIINSSLTPLQRMVKGMSLDEAERVYAKANDEEKAQLQVMIERKRLSHAREFVPQ